MKKLNRSQWLGLAAVAAVAAYFVWPSSALARTTPTPKPPTPKPPTPKPTTAGQMPIKLPPITLNQSSDSNTDSSDYDFNSSLRSAIQDPVSATQSTDKQSLGPETPGFGDVPFYEQTGSYIDTDQYS